GDGDTVLSEDPWVEVARKKTPTVLDPFALSRLARNHPELTAPLVQRLRDGGFSKVVLLRRPGSVRSQDWHAWYDRHLGESVVGAIAGHDRREVEAGGYFVYVRGPVAAGGRAERR